MQAAAERAAGLPQGRNEPAQLPRIAQTLAALRSVGEQELAEQLRHNAIEALPGLASLLPAPGQLGPSPYDNPPSSL